MINKKQILIWLQRIFPLLFLFFLIFTLQYPFTGFPKVKVQESYVPSHIQVSLSKIVNVDSIFGNWNQFVYFTTCSHIVVVITLLLEYSCKVKVLPEWRVAIFIYMFITAIIFWTSLAPVLPWGYNAFDDFVNVYEHLIVFLVVIVYFVYESKTKASLKKTFKVVFIFPLIYFLFCTILYASSKVAIYPFFAYADFFGLGLALGLSIFLCLLTVLGIIMIIILLSWLLTNYQLPVRKYFAQALSKIKLKFSKVFKQIS